MPRKRVIYHLIPALFPILLTILILSSGVESGSSAITKAFPGTFGYVVPTIESCDSTGTIKNSFDVSEDVYVKGSGYSPSKTFDIYVVNDVGTWTVGMSFPSRVAGTATTVSSDASGNIPTTEVWHAPTTIGKYDIVVDVDKDDIYCGFDALDDLDIGTAGFLIIPEYIYGTILGIIAIFAAYGAYGMSKRKHL